MLIHFEVIRVDDKVMGISSTSPDLPDYKLPLPLVAKKVKVAKYSLPGDVAGSFHDNLVKQMKGGSSEAD